ncbi:MAG: hypothetical protein IKR04_02980 [Clostridia bacterium]|nr:hypothetical protein [Clostridia bacterium]
MEKKKGLGIATLIIAIVGLIGCWIPVLNLLSYPFFIIAIIMGIIAAIKDNGRVLAIIGIVLSVIGWIVANGMNSLLGNAIEEGLKSYSGEDIVITQSGDIKTGSDWLNGLISEGIDEMNNQIEAGVTEISDTVTDINDQVVEGVEEGVENVNEGLENLGEDVAEVVTGEEVE